MERRTLGRTGLSVTSLSYNAMEFRGPRIWNGRPVGLDVAQRMLNLVLDSGVNFINTTCEDQRSEEAIGQFIAHRREEFVLGTKAGCVVEAGEERDAVRHDWTRATLMRNLEDSLRRMRTDHVDVWQLHSPRAGALDRAEVERVFEDARRSGKARWVGVMLNMPGLSAFLDWAVLDVVEMTYSAMQQRKNAAALEAVAAMGKGVVSRRSLGGGEPLSDRKGDERWVRWDLAKLDDLLSPGESPSAFLLRYTLSHPCIHTATVGTINPLHWAEDVRAARMGPLSAEVLAEVNRRLAAVGEVSQAFRPRGKA